MICQRITPENAQAQPRAARAKENGRAKEKGAPANRAPQRCGKAKRGEIGRRVYSAISDLRTDTLVMVNVSAPCSIARPVEEVA